MRPATHAPTLHLIVGINGSGKTTFYYRMLARRTPGAEFVNADEIERERWPDAVGEHSYEAGRLAMKRREELLDAGESFVTETVFSHESKLELIERARSLGFLVILYHVHVSSHQLASARVQTRVHQGGHDVPSEKVKLRFPRTLRQVQRAIERVDRLYVFDNSRLRHSHTHVMTLFGGEVTRLGRYMPDWVKQVYREPLLRYLEMREGKPPG